MSVCSANCMHAASIAMLRPPRGRDQIRPAGFLPAWFGLIQSEPMTDDDRFGSRRSGKSQYSATCRLQRQTTGGSLGGRRETARRSPHLNFYSVYRTVKSKRSPYSITERGVPELIPVLGSQPAGDVSHKPGGRLPLLSARPAVTLATLTRAATNFAAW